MEATHDGTALKDAKMRGAFNGLCHVAGMTVSRIPLAGQVPKFLCSRVNARWRYMDLHPLLMLQLQRSSVKDPVTQHLIEEIKATATFGAQRQNFENYYIKGNRLRDLPSDPDDIMYGFWG